MPNVNTLTNSAKCWYFKWIVPSVKVEKCFLDLLVALIHGVKKFSNTFTNFPHSLIGIFSVVTGSKNSYKYLLNHQSNLRVLWGRDFFGLHSLVMLLNPKVTSVLCFEYNKSNVGLLFDIFYCSATNSSYKASSRTPVFMEKWIMGHTIAKGLGWLPLQQHGG